MKLFVFAVSVAALSLVCTVSFNCFSGMDSMEKVANAYEPPPSPPSPDPPPPPPPEPFQKV